MKCGDWNEQVANIDLEFDWPNTGETASVNGAFIWRDNPLQFSARSETPMDLFAGGLSPLAMQVDSPLFSAQVEGSAATMSQLQVEGDFAFDTVSLHKFLGWLGVRAEAAKSLGPASLKARSNLVGASVAFTEMELGIDDNLADGVMLLDFRRDRPLIQGTVASEAINLTPYFGQSANADDLLGQALLSQNILSADLDIRLSSNNLSLGPVQLGRTAATLITRDSQLALSVGETFAYGGRVEASLNLKPSKTNPEKMRGQLRAKANGVSASTFGRELLGSENVTGTALAELEIQAEGMSLGDMLKAASGDISVVLTEGSIATFNLDGLQNALETGVNEEPDALYEGGTSFDVASLAGRIEEATLQFDTVRITSGQQAMTGSATLGLLEMELDFPGTISLYESTDPTTQTTTEPVKEFPFHLQGPILQPHLVVREDASGQAVETDAGEAEPNKEATPDPQAPPQTEPDNKAAEPANPADNKQQAVEEEGDQRSILDPLKSIGNAVEEILKGGEETDPLGIPLQTR